MGQWKLQMKVFREMNEERPHDTNGKERGPNLAHTESREQSEVVMVNSIDSPKQDQVGDPSCDMVPGTCMKCKSDIMGPPNDRGGDNMKTWHKYCKGCFTLVRRNEKPKCDTRDRHSEGTSNGDQVKHLINDVNPLTTHAVVDDLQEREMMIDVLRSLNEEQVETYNAIKLTNESMKTLMEQHVKTTSMINTLLIKLIEKDTQGVETKQGTTIDHTQLAVKRHSTSKEQTVKQGYQVW
jgi:hypothetical protein